MADSKNDNSKKQASDPQAERRKKTLRAAGVMLVPFAVSLYLIFGHYTAQNVPEADTGMKALPEGRGKKIEANKQKAIEQVAAEQSEQRRIVSLDDDFSLMAEMSEQEQAPEHDPVAESQAANREATKLMADFYSAPRADPQVDELRRQVEELQGRLAASDAAPDPMELAERQYALAAKYLGKSASAPEPERESGSGMKRTTPVLAVRGLGDNTVSSLAAPEPDSLVSEPGRERNFGFNTAVGRRMDETHNALRACVDEDQTLTSGDRIRLRLTEPAQAGGILLPAGELIFGTVNIVGQRMQVSVTGIEKDGNVLAVALDAYDLDGGKGLFVPDSEERTAAKEAAASVGAGLGSSISFTTNAGQQVAMDLVRGALTGGTQYVASKLRQVKVRVKAGYRLLLISNQ